MIMATTLTIMLMMHCGRSAVEILADRPTPIAYIKPIDYFDSVPSACMIVNKRIKRHRHASWPVTQT